MNKNANIATYYMPLGTECSTDWSLSHANDESAKRWVVFSSYYVTVKRPLQQVIIYYTEWQDPMWYYVFVARHKLPYYYKIAVSALTVYP